MAIPELRKPPEALLNATLVQPFFDPVDGKWNQVGSRDMAKIGGLLAWNDRLIVSVFHYYDASGTQQTSHFVSGRDLSVTTDAQGPYKVGKLLTGYTSGTWPWFPRSGGNPPVVPRSPVTAASRLSAAPPMGRRCLRSTLLRSERRRLFQPRPCCGTTQATRR